ncbi:dihydrodipicolinate reductase C-terminal domain-containing protein [Micromonospora sp. NBC_00617]|uniref:dihydrodipicolinate reductase C-terminal domain-containing protein n=1 Tax=Micromonospora sp. NBC_00617 TaxID=2903587 RepID=UPI0030E0730E
MTGSSAPVAGVVGATGRFGAALCSALESAGVSIGLRASRAGWTVVEPPTVVFDVSGPECFDRTVRLCRQWSAALVYAVSAVPDAHADRLRQLGRELPVVRATNLSIGHWIQVRLLEAVASLGPSLPVLPVAAVWERHPVTKADRPSASARELAEVWRASSGAPAADLTSVRAGHPVSDHAVQLDLPDESVTIAHAVTGIGAAVRGALLLLPWVSTAPTGLVTAHHIYEDIVAKGARHAASPHH